MTDTTPATEVEAQWDRLYGKTPATEAGPFCEHPDHFSDDRDKAARHPCPEVDSDDPVAGDDEAEWLDD
jgi:hypothetical protein